MSKISLKNFVNKFTSLLLITAIFLAPLNYVFAAEASSTNFRVSDSFSAGSQMDSTNFSVTGGLEQSSFGTWATNGLPLAPGTITSCGKITTSGTYTLSTNLTGISGSCFVIQANNVVINGAGFSVTASAGNSNYAVVATSSVSGAVGYGTTTIQNIIFSGFGAGINSSGNANVSGSGGNGGDVVVSTSTIGTIVSNGGLGSNGGTTGGFGGNIIITNSNTGSVTSSGAVVNGPGSSGGAGGGIIVSNSTTGNVISIGERSYPGGVITISSSSVVGLVSSSGGGSTYNNASGLGVGGNISIASSTISGTVTSAGAPTGGSEGAAGGTIIVSNSNTGTVSSLGGGGSSSSHGGAGGNISITTNSSISGSVISTAGYGVYSNAIPGGVITVSNSVVSGALTTIGGDSNNSTYYTNRLGGVGGNVSVSSSSVGSILSQGGKGANNSGAGNVGGNGGAAGTITFNNSTSTGAISALPGAAGIGSGGATNGAVGAGATTTIATSSTASVTSSGANGAIVITGVDLNLSNNTYSASSTLSLSYSGNLTTNSTTLSALTNFIINSTNLGSYIGGAFPIIPGTINSCGTIYFAGTYNLSGNSTSNCNILHSGAIIAGAGNTLTGNITANNYGVTLSNLNVTGAVSTTGATPGALTINNASNLLGTVSVTGVLNGDGSGSLGNTTINAGASVSTSSVSFVSDVLNNGVINAGNSVAGKTTNNTIINGDFIFNASSTNSGTVNGNAILNSSSTNSGTITGTARFNMYTAVGGAVTFASTTNFSGTGYVNGNLYDSTNAQITSWIFNASSTNIGILKGNAVFNNTSSNIISGTVQGNATFNNTSTNLGIVTGNSEVYAPVVRPLGGTTNGQVTYHNYAGLYFNDTAAGHGTTGKWDDILNWWTDAAFTIHSPIIPTSGDDVLIYGNLTNTSATAFVRTATFQNNSDNGITVIVSSTSTDAALFNASSTNSGTIIGNATFAGPDTENTGTVTGYITRQYNAGVFVVVRDFTHNGVHWIVQAINGASVDLSGATYSFITNTFQTLNNGFFSAWNSLINGGAQANPELIITTPTSGTNIKWQPVVSWGTNVLCQYKIDGGVYTSVLCSNNGSDIPRPSANTAHTIFFRSTDAHNNITEKSVLFTYDNTQPVDTDCATALDESSRAYYYLTSNVGNCVATASTTLRGDDGAGHYYTVGSLTGSSTNIVLENISATGTVSGFNNITVSSSTLSGVVTVNGILTSDTKSSFGNTTVQSGGVINSGNFVGNLINDVGGSIVNSTTTPVTVALNTTNNGNISGGFIFNFNSTNAGTVTGTSTFNGTSVNTGTVNGNVVLNNSATNAGIINGDLFFGSLSAINGAVTFSGSTDFSGTNTNNTNGVSGNIYDHAGNLITRWIFNNSSRNIGSLKGKAFFNDTSANLGKVFGDAHFSDSSTNVAGIIDGNVYAYNSVTSAFTGTVTDGHSVTYYSYPNGRAFNNVAGDYSWNNLANWFTDTTFEISLGRTPTSGENIVLFASTTLPSNLTNDIFFGVSSSTLDGAEHTLNGNISGNGAYGGEDAYNFNLINITVTGTTTAIGGDGTPTIDGGKGGIINIATSSTGVVTVNGGDPQQNGGDAGEVTITNSYAVQENTPLLAVGGDSSGCGYGGNGGNISLYDSSGYLLITDMGADANINCEVPPTPPTHRTSGQVFTQGTYISPSARAAAAAAANPTHSIGGILRNIFNKNIKPIIFSLIPNFNLFDGNFKPKAVGNTVVPYPFQNFRIPPVLSLVTLPKNFEPDFYRFLFAPVTNTFGAAQSKFQNFFNLLGIKTEQELASLTIKPVVIRTDSETENLPGHFIIKTSDQKIVTYVIYDPSQGGLSELVKVSPNQPLSIAVIPTIQSSDIVTAPYLDKTIYFTKDQFKLSTQIITPNVAGKYVLKTSVSPVSLIIEVVEPPKPEVQQLKPWGIFNFLWKLFN